MPLTPIAEKLLQQSRAQTGQHITKTEEAIVINHNVLPTIHEGGNEKGSWTGQWSAEEITTFKTAAVLALAEKIVNTGDSWIIIGAIAEMLFLDEGKAKEFAVAMIRLSVDNNVPVLDIFEYYFGREITYLLIQDQLEALIQEEGRRSQNAHKDGEQSSIS